MKFVVERFRFEDNDKVSEHMVTSWHGNALQWRPNGHDNVSNHQPHHCLLSRLFGRRSKKTSKLRVTGLCAGNSPVPGEIPAQMASYAENISFWWHHHGFLNYWPFVGNIPVAAAFVTKGQYTELWSLLCCWLGQPAETTVVLPVISNAVTLMVMIFANGKILPQSKINQYWHEWRLRVEHAISHTSSYRHTFAPQDSEEKFRHLGHLSLTWLKSIPGMDK